MDWHLNTQNKDYLDLSIKRLNEPALIWVSQFTDIINSKINSFCIVTTGTGTEIPSEFKCDSILQI